MAINAKFVADFSSFLSAVQEADVKLKDFGSGAATVSSSLSRMVDNFSGRKLIEEATKTAEAVDRIGGVSKLTEEELQKVAAQASNAAAKMTALGIDVPPKIANLASEVKNARTGLEEMKSIAESVAGALGVAFTISEIAQFVGDTLTAARSLRNLSLETRIGTDELQVMSSAAKDFGVEGDLLGRAIFQLSRRIAGDDASAVSALHQMGMSLQDVKGLNGEELFLKIERGLRGVQDNLKDTTAADLFGAKLGGAMIAVSSHLDDTMAHVRQMNTLMDKDAVAAAAHYADALDHLKDSVKGVTLNLIGPLVDGLNTLIDATGRSASKWEVFKAILKDTLGSNLLTGPQVSNLATLLDQQNRTPKDIELPKPSAAPTVPISNADIFSKIALDSLKALTAEQQHYLEQLFDIGQLNAKNAASFGVNAEQMDLFKKKQDEIIQAQVNLSANLKEGAKLYSEIDAAGSKATDDLNKKTMAWLWATTAAIQGLKDLNRTAQESLNDRSLGGASRGSNADQAAEKRDKALAEIDAQQAAMQASGVNADDAMFGARRAKIWADFDDAIMKGGATAASLSTAHTGAVQAANNVTAAFTQLAQASMPKASAGDAVGLGTHQTDPRITSYMSMGYTQGEALALVSGYGTSIGLPHRADGGPVTGGQSYMVGERGPELFTPGTNGSITPNGGGIRVGDIHIHGNADSAAARGLAEQIAKEIFARVQGQRALPMTR